MVKVNPDRGICYQLTAEVNHSSNVDEDSDIEMMFPAPDEGPPVPVVYTSRCLYAFHF